MSVFRQELVGRIGQDQFQLWLGSGTSFEFTAGQMLISVSSPFKLERLRRHQGPFHAAAQAAGIGGIQLVVDERLVEKSTEADTPPNRAAVEVAATVPGPRRRPPARLQDYIVGDSNRVAFTACESLPRRLGALSPLFMYGPSGTGKTHLLEGIVSSLRRQGNGRRCLYLSAEQFTTQFLAALQGSGLPSFRRKYRGVDVLLLDDVQFFAGKRATLVELQHTVDTLLREGRQLVLAADRPPADLMALGPELATRMAGGLVCGIEWADRATRLGILRRRAKGRAVRFPTAVLEMLASELPGDARHLSGAMNRLEATSQALKEPVTVEFATRTLEDLLRSIQRVVRLTDIDQAVCDVFGLEPNALQSARKGKAISHPRMLAMWLARKHTRAALNEIGQYFGRRTHSTVISAQKKVSRWMSDGSPMQLAHGNCPVEDAVRKVEHRLRTGS